MPSWRAWRSRHSPDSPRTARSNQQGYKRNARACQMRRPCHAHVRRQRSERQLRQPHIRKTFGKPGGAERDDEATQVRMHAPHGGSRQHTHKRCKCGGAAVFAHASRRDTQQRHRCRRDEQRCADERASEFAFGDASEDRDNERIQQCMLRRVVHDMRGPQSPPFARREGVAIQGPCIGTAWHECHTHARQQQAWRRQLNTCGAPH
jgi:hypothetical protein